MHAHETDAEIGAWKWWKHRAFRRDVLAGRIEREWQIGDRSRQVVHAVELFVDLSAILDREENNVGVGRGGNGVSAQAGRQPGEHEAQQ
jgi:hypothetical protein